MFSDGIIKLVENGVITNANKVVRPGKVVTSFVIGTENVFKFLHDNPLIGESLQLNFYCCFYKVFQINSIEY